MLEDMASLHSGNTWVTFRLLVMGFLLADQENREQLTFGVIVIRNYITLDLFTARFTKGMCAHYNTGLMRASQPVVCVFV